MVKVQTLSALSFRSHTRKENYAKGSVFHAAKQKQSATKVRDKGTSVSVHSSAAFNMQTGPAGDTQHRRHDTGAAHIARFPPTHRTKSDVSSTHN